MTFAIDDFAGGETTRAMRYALTDLQDYLDYAHIREEHACGRWRLTADQETTFDLAWLRAERGLLEPLWQACARIYKDHSHGVVYAVRFNRTDLEGLELHPTMGIKAFRRVPPSRVVAKVEIPKGAAVPLGMPGKSRERYFQRLGNPCGLLALLASEKRGLGRC
jgi:hypothetical protein